MIKLLSDKEREERFQDWWENWASNVDMFSRSYCGYWLRLAGYLENHDVLIVYEHNDEPLSSDKEDEIVESYLKQNKELPENWHEWSKDTAREAYRIGERLWGESWVDRADSIRYDVVVQMALFGEVKYG